MPSPPTEADDQLNTFTGAGSANLSKKNQRKKIPFHTAHFASIPLQRWQPSSTHMEEARGIVYVTLFLLLLLAWLVLGRRFAGTHPVGFGSVILLSGLLVSFTQGGQTKLCCRWTEAWDVSQSGARSRIRQNKLFSI